MVIAQGEIWWADLGEPVGSAPGYRRPVLVVQGDALNRSRVANVVCVPLTSNLIGSAPGDRRPVLVVQGDALNRSRIATVVCVPLTSQLKWADAPGNVALSAGASGLDKDSVANVSLVVALDKDQLIERVGKVTPRKLALVLAGIDLSINQTII